MREISILNDCSSGNSRGRAINGSTGSLITTLRGILTGRRGLPLLFQHFCLAPAQVYNDLSKGANISKNPK